jgi:hypothetical protein
MGNQSLSSEEDLSDQMGSSSHHHSTNPSIKKPTLMTFAAKKSLFFASSEKIKKEDFNRIYGKNITLVRELEAMAVVKTRDPFNLFYVKSFGTLDITKFIKDFSLRSGLSELQNNEIRITDEKSLPANVAFSVMNHNPFDLKTFLNKLNSKKTMMFYHTFLQMMLNLLNRLIIMHFQFYHCDVKPPNIMF